MWVEIETLSKRPTHIACSLLQEVCINNCGQTMTFLKGLRWLTQKPIPFKDRRELANKEAK